MDAPYRNTLEIARTELENLISEESDLDSRLQTNRTRQAGLKKTIDSLSSLVGEDVEETITGISQAIRTVLRNHTSKKTVLTPVGIRDRITEAGFDLGDYKNPMAVIHTTLKRLQDQREIEAVEGKDKRIGYRWIDQYAGITDDDVPF